MSNNIKSIIEASKRRYGEKITDADIELVMGLNVEDITVIRLLSNIGNDIDIRIYARPEFNDAQISKLMQIQFVYGNDICIKVANPKLTPEEMDKEAIDISNTTCQKEAVDKAHEFVHSLFADLW